VEQGEILAIVVTNHVILDVVCFTNLPSYVFARPTSAAIMPTQVVATLIYISTR